MGEVMHVMRLLLLLLFSVCGVEPHALIPSSRFTSTWCSFRPFDHCLPFFFPGCCCCFATLRMSSWSTEDRRRGPDKCRSEVCPKDQKPLLSSCCAQVTSQITPSKPKRREGFGIDIEIEQHCPATGNRIA